MQTPTFFRRGAIAGATLLFLAATALAQNWPQWRGPTGNGVAAPGTYPVAFSATNGVLWKAALPGRGNSTPVVWGNRVALTAGVGEGTNGLDGVLCFDFQTGKQLWQTTFGPQRIGKHRRGNGSCPSPVTDGERIIVYFKSGTLAALDFDGRVLWKTNLQERYGKDSLWWDLGTSPILADGKVIVATLHEGYSYIVALDPASGREVWKVDRNYPCPTESGQSYDTPLAIERDGRTVLLVWGADRLTGHDAATGKTLWECGGFNPDSKAYWRNIASPAYSQGVALVPYGREQFLAGVRTGGSGDVTATARLWEKRGIGTDGATPIAVDGKAYVVNFKGRVWCLDLPTGQELWTAMLPSGKGVFYGSPALAGDTLYFCREEGAVYVGRISATGLELVNETRFDDAFIASPVLVRDRLLLRGEKALYCIGK
jgi:outer membrane protein assembly factor BamB